jgi:hypothetical protein
VNNSNFTRLIGPRFVLQFFREGWGPKLVFVQPCSFGEMAMTLYA